MIGTVLLIVLIAVLGFVLGYVLATYIMMEWKRGREEEAVFIYLDSKGYTIAKDDIHDALKFAER